MYRRKGRKVVFDENSRREFVTGFHKRKVARRKKAEEEFEQQLKEAKKRIREKAKETYSKLVTPFEQFPENVEASEIEYELPEHTVKVRELLADDIAEQNNWIGQNRVRLDAKTGNEGNSDEVGEAEEAVPGMSITSLRQAKHIVNKQSGALMRNDEIFRKKNKLERLKNRKKASRKRNLLKREKKKLKGRKRK